MRCLRRQREGPKPRWEMLDVAEKEKECCEGGGVVSEGNKEDIPGRGLG